MLRGQSFEGGGTPVGNFYVLEDTVRGVTCYVTGVYPHQALSCVRAERRP